MCVCVCVCVRARAHVRVHFIFTVHMAHKTTPGLIHINHRFRIRLTLTPDHIMIK